MSDDKLKGLEDLLNERGKSLKLYERLEEVVRKFIDEQPNALERAITISALAHLAADIVGNAACCAYHGFEVWETVGSNVIVGGTPEEAAAWLEKMDIEETDEVVDYTQGLPFNKDKLH